MGVRKFSRLESLGWTPEHHSNHVRELFSYDLHGWVDDLFFFFCSPTSLFVIGHSECLTDTQPAMRHTCCSKTCAKECLSKSLMKHFQDLSSRFDAGMLLESIRAILIWYFRTLHNWLIQHSTKPIGRLVW